MESFLASGIPEFNSLDKLSLLNVDEVVTASNGGIMVSCELILVDKPKVNDSNL